MIIATCSLLYVDDRYEKIDDRHLPAINWRPLCYVIISGAPKKLYDAIGALSVSADMWSNDWLETIGVSGSITCKVHRIIGVTGRIRNVSSYVYVYDATRPEAIKTKRIYNHVICRMLRVAGLSELSAVIKAINMKNSIHKVQYKQHYRIMMLLDWYELWSTYWLFRFLLKPIKEIYVCNMMISEFNLLSVSNFPISVSLIYSIVLP